MSELNDLNVTDASNTARQPEGQAASTVNDGIRALEGILARADKDTNGSLVSTGAADVFALAANQTIASYYDGLTFVFEVGTTNTGAATLNVDAVGAQAIRWPNGTALAAGDMPSQAKMKVIYDLGQTRWQLQTVPKRPQDNLDVPSQAEAEAGTATTERVWTAERVKQAIAALETSTDAQTLDKNYLTGCILSNDADAAHDINAAAGEARNSDDTADLALSSEQTKRIDASWATGDDAGGLSSSLTVANATWYHVFLVLIASTVEVGFDTSLTADNLVSDHFATKFRRIGSVFTDGTANILGFTQIGDELLWDDPPLDIQDDNPGTSAVTRTLSTPLGIRVLARVNFTIQDATPGISCHGYLSSLDQDDEASSETAGPLAHVKKEADEGGDTSQVAVWTNTSSQIRSRISASDADIDVNIATTGWLDPRGKQD